MLSEIVPLLSAGGGLLTACVAIYLSASSRRKTLEEANSFTYANAKTAGEALVQAIAIVRQQRDELAEELARCEARIAQLKNDNK
jgi:hypothetical protein